MTALTKILGAMSGTSASASSKATPSNFGVNFDALLTKTSTQAKSAEKATIFHTIQDGQGMHELQHPLTQLELSLQFLTVVRDKIQGIHDKLTAMQM